MWRRQKANRMPNAVYSLRACKAMRTVIPLILADYGFRTALFDLFDPMSIPIHKARGIACIAAAYIHHDANKMSEYEQRLSKTNERFFAGYRIAPEWIVAFDEIGSECGVTDASTESGFGLLTGW